MSSPVVEQWQQVLAKGGYERRISSRPEYWRLKKLSRTWRLIRRSTQLEAGASVFEVGCGGGNQLVPLAVNSHKCVGIDCSGDVLARCKVFISDVEKFAGHPLDIELIHGDFLCYSSDTRYDCVFNFGVIEHFLDDCERESFLRAKFRLCIPGGYVISVVPNGHHPLRARMRMEGLGGYCVPEIDYSPEKMIAEAMQAGADHVQVIPHNLFGYLLCDTQAPLVRRIINRFAYLCAQLLPRLRRDWQYKHAGILVCIARKAKGAPL